MPSVEPTEESVNSTAGQRSIYHRAESRLLAGLPPWITPLRFRILLGYISVAILAIYGWEQIASAWGYLATLLAPVAALLGALLALKLSVVAVSLFTLLTALLKAFLGFLMVVLKPGILKAIFVPQFVVFAGWIHRKSARLQTAVGKLYEWIKARAQRLMCWWKSQNLTDKILLSGFIIPLLIIVLIVFVVKRAVAIFAMKKATEQIVQKTTKFVLGNFHRLPLIGGVPATLSRTTRKLTARGDRKDLMTDLRNLGRQFYKPRKRQ